MQIGLITNARSRRNQRLLPVLREAVGRRAGVHSFELDGIDGLGRALRQFREREVGLIVVVGGGGTVQAVLTRLLSGDRCGFAVPPILAVLAGGTTNMTAADVGLPERPDRALRRLLESRTGDGFEVDGEILSRHVLEIRRDGEAPLHGMFFGIGAICRAIGLARRSVHPMKLGSSLESGLTLAGVFGERLFRKGGNGEGGVLQGDDVSITVDEGEPVRRPTLLALATTLDRLVLRSRPFWGKGRGALRYTRIAYPAPRFWRSVPAILYGPGRAGLPQPDYQSCNAEHLRIEMDGAFTLDGEMFMADRGVPLEIRAHQQVRFLRF